jgi:hypothetical protein
MNGDNQPAGFLRLVSNRICATFPIIARVGILLRIKFFEEKGNHWYHTQISNLKIGCGFPLSESRKVFFAVARRHEERRKTARPTDRSILCIAWSALLRCRQLTKDGLFVA